MLRQPHRNLCLISSSLFGIFSCNGRINHRKGADIRIYNIFQAILAISNVGLLMSVANLYS